MSLLLTLLLTLHAPVLAGGPPRPWQPLEIELEPVGSWGFCGLGGFDAQAALALWMATSESPWHFGLRAGGGACAAVFILYNAGSLRSWVEPAISLGPRRGHHGFYLDLSAGVSNVEGGATDFTKQVEDWHTEFHEWGPTLALRACYRSRSGWMIGGESRALPGVDVRTGFSLGKMMRLR